MRDELIAALIARTGVGSARPATVLISSHDLGEVEAFATHVGFLHQGKFLFTEELAALTRRFREVTVNFAGSVEPTAAGSALPAMTGPANIATPAHMPASWLLPERVATAFASCIRMRIRKIFRRRLRQRFRMPPAPRACQ